MKIDFDISYILFQRFSVRFYVFHVGFSEVFGTIQVFLFFPVIVLTKTRGTHKTLNVSMSLVGHRTKFISGQILCKGRGRDTRRIKGAESVCD